MNNSRQNQNTNAFTLIELLVVIGIIAILASLVLATSGFVQDKAARSRAEAEIAALSAALESYKVDNGEYPEGTNTNSAGANKFLITALMPEPPKAGDPPKKVYFEFSKRMLDNPDYLKATKVLDPYGKSYNYQFPGDATKSGVTFFDLWSTGKKASRGTLTQEEWEAQWIKNW